MRHVIQQHADFFDLANNLPVERSLKRITRLIHLCINAVKSILALLLSSETEQIFGLYLVFLQVFSYIWLYAWVYVGIRRRSYISLRIMCY